MVRFLTISFLLFASLLFCKENWAQKENDPEVLLKQGDFEGVINTLLEKERHSTLSNRNFSILIFSLYQEGRKLDVINYSDKWIERGIKEKDTSTILSGYSYKSATLYALDRIEEAFDICITSQKLARVPQDSLAITKNLIKLGLFYYLLDSNDKAIHTYQLIDSNLVKRHNYLEYFTNQAIIYGKGDPELDLKLQLKHLNASKKAKKISSIALSYSNISAAYMSLHDEEMAIKYLDSIHLYGREEDDPETFQLVYQNYYTAYVMKGNTDSAFFYLEKLKVLNQTLFERKMDLEINELKRSHQIESDLRTKNEAIQRELEESKRVRLIIVIVVLLVILLLVILTFVLFYRNMKVKNKHVISEQKLLRSQMTPHFMYNSLAVIQGMILNKEDEKAASYLSKFSRLMRLVLENSRNKLVDLKAEIKAVDHYLILQAMRFDDSFTHSITIDPSINSENIQIPPMVIQPFVENCIEHGFNPSGDEQSLIDIHLQMKGSTLVCTIQDNGKGLSAPKDNINNDKQSVSTQIIRERLLLLGKELKSPASLTIVDRQTLGEKGTLVSIHIPYKNMAL